MNSELAPKIIVASGMAIVVGIIAVTFALRSNHPSPVAQISQPAAALAQTPDVPAAVAPIPDAAAAVVSQDHDGAGNGDPASLAVEPQVGGKPDPGKALVGADSTARTVPRETTVNSREKSAAKTRAKSGEGAKSVRELTMPSATTRTAVDGEAEAATGNEPASPDIGSPRS